MPPINTDCASAHVLTGCGGTVAASNIGWAGVWPVGGDPLFNLLGFGGGAPLWYRWTNTTPFPLLFRVTISAPASLSVHYNFAFITGPRCGSLTAIDDSDFDVTTISGTSASNFNPAFATDFDEVVQPGDTIWFEIDSYDGDVSEPPNASAHLGNFQFAWAALTFTQYDTLEGAFGTPPTTLLANGFSPSTNAIVPYDVLRHGDRLYFTWTFEDTHGESLMVADCALDGSGMNVVKLSDGSMVAHQWRNSRWGVPQLRTDGTDVFVGYPYLDSDVAGQQVNPDYNPAHGSAANVFVCTQTTTSQFHYRVHRYVAGAWPVLFDIGADNITPGGGFLWNCDPSSIGTQNYRAAMTADPSQPGKIWIHASYVVTRLYQSLHFNDFPLGFTPPGSYYCTEDVEQVEERVETYLINVGGATCSKVLSAAGTPIVISYWVSDDPTIDPIFGPWQTFAEGPWLTMPDGDFPMIGHWQFWLVNDTAYPIIVSTALLTLDQNGATFANTIDIARLDTSILVQTIPFSSWTFATIIDGGATIIENDNQNLIASPRFFNSETGREERIIGANWFIPSLSLAEGWIARIADDGTGSLSELVPEDGPPSSKQAPLQSVVPDNPRDWWAFRSYYDRLCNHQWETGYDPRFGSDHLGANWAVSSRPLIELANGYFYFMVANGDLRRSQIEYDYFICEVGPPCLPPPVLRGRFKAHH